VGKVLECEPHPNADKLRVCKVDIGTETPSSIVCGAPNVKAGLFVPVATLGTHLPRVQKDGQSSGLTIKPAKLRGVPSEGMICSLAELGLAKDSEGIHHFDNEPPIGSDVRPLLGLDDVILDLTSTANRADALSMVGIAREVAALTGQPLRLPDATMGDIEATSFSPLILKVLEPQACPIYLGTVLEGVTIAPSPVWMQQRLQSASIRSINNVVDITNYILLEWGQPLHAFDYDRLLAASQSPSAVIGVRFAESKEVLKTLDGQERSLSEQALLITANNNPVALAGVMGGEDTEVHAETRSLLLEAAVFDAAVIRRSARSQGLRTEASARYERGVNSAELSQACRRTLSLLLEFAGGRITTQAKADYRGGQAAVTRSIELRLQRVNQILGPVKLGEEATGELQPQEIEHILRSLGCELTLTNATEVWSVTVPPYRLRDLEREIDLIEEIARLYGYNNFCETLPEKTEPGYLSIDQALMRKLREAFRAAGLTEVMHYSLTKPGQPRQIVLTNPLFPDYSALRTDLLSGLLDAFEYNLEQGNGCLNGFEIGRIFWSEEDGFNEANAVGGIFGGDRMQGRWLSGGKESPMTWFEAKGLLESAFNRLGLVVEYQPDRRDERLHPGRTASLWLGGDRLGTFGQIHPQVRQERNFPDSVYAFELDLDVLFNHLDQDEAMIPTFKPYSSYPASDRDLAFYVPTQFSVAEIERVIQKVGKPLLESVELFDEYRGDRVPAGQRSLAFRLVYRAFDRTLTDEDIEPVHQKVRDTLVEKFRVDLRS